MKGESQKQFPGWNFSGFSRSSWPPESCQLGVPSPSESSSWEQEIQVHWWHLHIDARLQSHIVWFHWVLDRQVLFFQSGKRGHVLAAPAAYFLWFPVSDDRPLAVHSLSITWVNVLDHPQNLHQQCEVVYFTLVRKSSIWHCKDSSSTLWTLLLSPLDLKSLTFSEGSGNSLMVSLKAVIFRPNRIFAYGDFHHHLLLPLATTVCSSKCCSPSISLDVSIDTV